MDLICLIKEKYDLKKTAKSYIIDTTECGFYCPPNIAKKAMAGSLDIVDLPAVEGQLHIHNDTGHSHLKPYGNDNIKHFLNEDQAFNLLEDAKKLGLKKLEK